MDFRCVRLVQYIYDVSAKESEGEEEEFGLEPYQFETVTVVDGSAHDLSSEDNENNYDRPFLEDEEWLTNTNWYVSVIVVVVLYVSVFKHLTCDL